ncbi:phage tail protein [Pseudomonas sp. JDS08PS003]|uniref:phage tail protein n=1 Tax=Pseudomonas sp. JDS08PS003 TaxID=2497162 RepID=UPI0038575636
MIDSNSQFFAILTAVGEAKQANATALGVPWTFKEMAVGDANGTDPIPNRNQTKLINEWRRAPVNQVRTDPANPNIIITEQVIPSDVGGRWIREIGLFDADGDLVAVANCAPSFKPLLAQGTGKTQVIRMNFIVSNAAQIVLKIDPAVVLATRQYVDDSLAAALPADKAPGTYRVVTIDKRGIVVSGSNPTTLGGFGITDGVTKAEMNVAVSGLLPKAGGVVSGSIMLDNGAVDSPEIGWRTPEIDARLDVANKSIRFFAVVNGELTFPLVMSVPDKTASFFGNIAWHAGNFNPESKANKATTLAAYGITDAYTKFEVETVVKAQASETVRGAVRIATIEDVNAGNDDTAVVTPKKLFNGAVIITGNYAALKLPSWLGGWILQKGSVNVTAEGGAGASVSVTLPIAYTGSYALNATFVYSGGRLDNGNVPQVRDKSLNGFTVDNQWMGSGSSLAGVIDFFAFGR